MKSLILLLLLPSSCFAQSGIFQIDVEQNQRLDGHDERLRKLEAVSEALYKIPYGAQKPSDLGKALQSAPAYEIHNGVRVHTSDAHLIHHGYSPAQFAGLTPDQKDRLHGAAHLPQKSIDRSVQPVATVSAGYAEVCNSHSCRRIRRR